MFLSPDTKAEKSTGNQCVDGSANVCNQQVGGSNPSTSSNAIEYGGIPEWPNGTDCKSAGNAFGGSNPPSPTNKRDIHADVSFIWRENRGGFEPRALRNVPGEKRHAAAGGR